MCSKLSHTLQISPYEIEIPTLLRKSWNLQTSIGRQKFLPCIRWAWTVAHWTVALYLLSEKLLIHNFENRIVAHF